MRPLSIMIASSMLLLSGCATWVTDQRSDLARTGPSTQFSETKTKTYADAQTAVYTQLKVMTGKTTPNEDDVIAAGLQYADALCSDYIESLYWVNKQLKADIRDINSLGTLTTGAMGIAKTAASSIAGAAVLFGYAGETMNTMGSRILYDLEPSSIRALVEGSQKSFRNALQTGYQTRAGTFTVIREYISLCVPSRIEAEINNAAKNAVPIASTGNPTQGESPTVSINSSQVTANSYTYSSDVYSALLKSYVFPNGVENTSASDSLSAWLKSNRITDPLGIFLISSKYKNQWKDAVEYLHAHGNPVLQ